MTTDEMAREVYEFYTGKKVGHLNLDGTYVICPPLATSRKAWEPIWEAMTDEQLWEHSLELARAKMPTYDNIPDDALVTFNMGDCNESEDKTLCIEARFGHHFFRATAMHHLTAAYAVMKGA